MNALCFNTWIHWRQQRDLSYFERREVNNRTEERTGEKGDGGDSGKCGCLGERSGGGEGRREERGGSGQGRREERGAVQSGAEQ